MQTPIRRTRAFKIASSLRMKSSAFPSLSRMRMVLYLSKICKYPLQPLTPVVSDCIARFSPTTSDALDGRRSSVYFALSTPVSRTWRTWSAQNMRWSKPRKSVQMHFGRRSLDLRRKSLFSRRATLRRTRTLLLLSRHQRPPMSRTVRQPLRKSSLPSVIIYIH